jgi:hypothetical protein
MPVPVVSPQRIRERKVPTVLNRLAPAGIALALVATSAAASTTSVIQLSGFSWEDGTLSTSVLGDELTAVGVVTHIKRPLFWSPSRYSYTWCAQGLVSLGESLYGTTQVIEYSGGMFCIRVDGLPSNALYGEYPPNATVPSTFTDGHAVYLEGRFIDFTMTLNSATGGGAVFGSISFTGGNAYPQLMSPDGWTVGATLTRMRPAGWDVDWNGALFVSGPLGVEDASWADIKALYR